MCNLRQNKICYVILTKSCINEKPLELYCIKRVLSYIDLRLTWIPLILRKNNGVFL